MSNEVAEIARLRPAELQTAQTANDAVPTVVASITTALQHAVSTMGADDISLEFVSDLNGPRSHTRFSLRAYRRGRQVAQVAAGDRDV